MSKQAVNLPKKVEELVKEIKEGNPSYDEAQTWATAWSVYCKYISPGGEHCSRPPAEYLLKTADVVDPGWRSRQASPWHEIIREASEKEAIRPRPPPKDSCAAPESYSDYRKCTDAERPLTEDAWKARHTRTRSHTFASTQGTNMNPEHDLLLGLTKLAQANPAMRAHLLPIIREAVSKKESKLQSRQEAILKKYLAAAGARAVQFFDDLPPNIQAALRQVKDQETLHMDVDRWLGDNNNPHLRPMWAASEKKAHGPVTRNMNPDVMLFMIDRSNNNSKFYEMAVVPAGSEGPAKKSKVWTGRGWVLQRRWGRLADTPSRAGNPDSINDFFADETQARRMMADIKREKTGKGYEDVSRTREYPIGLGGAGFGWGGQAACAYIPELVELSRTLNVALASVTKAQGYTSTLAKQNSTMGEKLEGMLEGVEAGLNGVVAYLDGQLKHCV